MKVNCLQKMIPQKRNNKMQCILDNCFEHVFSISNLCHKNTEYGRFKIKIKIKTIKMFLLHLFLNELKDA